MMKKKRFVLSVMLVFCLSLLLSACTSSKSASVTVGRDEIPTLYSVVGERKITGTEAGFKNDVHYKILTYKSGAVSDNDLQSYIDSLQREDDFICTQSSSVEDNVLTLQLGKESMDNGKIVLVDVQYSKTDGVVIRYSTEKGTIVPNSSSSASSSLS